MTVLRGSDLPQSKLTEEDVIEIRAEVAANVDEIGWLPRWYGQELGARYGVSRSTISNIRRGYCWGWVK